MQNPQTKDVECRAGIHTMCVAREIRIDDADLDHIDVLGYSGAAFRIHTLSREVLCPSTVSPRFGYKIESVKKADTPLSALEKIVMLNSAEKFDEYFSGTAAYSLWIELLESDEESEYYAEQLKAHVEDNGISVMNKYCYASLVHARQAAAPFLERRSEEIPGMSADIIHAADCYAQVFRHLRSIANPEWTQEQRAAQAVILREVQSLEAKAVHTLAQVFHKA